MDDKLGSLWLFVKCCADFFHEISWLQKTSQVLLHGEIAFGGVLEAIDSEFEKFANLAKVGVIRYQRS